MNCLAAGFFPHEGSVTAKPAEADHIVGSRIAANRAGRVHELGWISAYLCSPYAAYITGQILFIDGGEHLRRSVRMPAYVPPRQREWLWQ